MITLSAEQVRAELLGAWRLESWQSIKQDGTIDYPLGPDAAGQLMYDDSDRVSAQLVRVGQPRFASDDWRQASAEEMCAAWPSYFGYFGTFSIDAETKTVTHHIEAGWFPNLAGSQQLRHYRFDKHRLVLDADTAWGQVKIIWKKLHAKSSDAGSARRNEPAGLTEGKAVTGPAGWWSECLADTERQTPAIVQFARRTAALSSRCL